MLALEDARPDWLLLEPVPDVGRVCDRGTIGHLETLRVATGWRCLEIGADSDRIAGWLHARVSPSGRVVSTDLLPTHPLEPGAFDLVHARLVLTHLADRRAALASMVAALAPGGWLLVEDADWSEWTRAIEINLMGTVLPCRAAVSQMKKAGHGKIINLSGGGATGLPAAIEAIENGASVVLIVLGLHGAPNTAGTFARRSIAWGQAAVDADRKA